MGLQPGLGRVTPGFSFPVFSSTRPGSSPGSAGFWVDPLGRAGFQNYVLNWEPLRQALFF